MKRKLFWYSDSGDGVFSEISDIKEKLQTVSHFSNFSRSGVMREIGKNRTKKGHCVVMASKHHVAQQTRNYFLAIFTFNDVIYTFDAGHF